MSLPAELTFTRPAVPDGSCLTSAVSGEATSDAPGARLIYDVGHPITLKGP
jgi:hypothetical protein